MIGYLSLGSNIGDRRANLQAAIDHLSAQPVTPMRASSVYDTEPVGLVLDQPEFLNACVEVETDLDPQVLLDACKSVERELGRTPGPRHGPRMIDVDILTLGDRSYVSERLSVPHPELTNRRFVLVPLLELAPDLRLPGGERLAGSLAALPSGQEVRLAGPPLHVGR